MRWLIAALLLLFVAAPAVAQRRIAFTFDDVPRGRGPFFTPDERAKRLIAGLRAAGVQQAAFFVVPGQIGNGDGIGGEGRAAAYVSSGHVIANHSYTHRHLNAISAQAYIADIVQAEVWLKGRAGYRPWFRYPFLDEGGEDKAKRDEVRSALKSLGLRNGYATADGSDWHIESLTGAAVKAEKAIDRTALRDFYVETLVGAANFADQLAVKTWGRQPAHVMVLHETDLAALYIADLAAALRKDGWTIVSADEAYADEIASLEPDTPSANGTLLELAAWEKRVPPPRWYEANDEERMKRAFAERVLHEKADQPSPAR